MFQKHTFVLRSRAVIHDRPECVEALMDSRADPNVAFMGDTPLSIAARHNRKRIVQYGHERMMKPSRE